MSELTDWQAAIVRAVEILHEVIEESVDEDQVSISGVAVELYLVAMSKSNQYWTASFEIVDHFCEITGIDRAECRAMAINLLAQAQHEIAERN